MKRKSLLLIVGIAVLLLLSATLIPPQCEWHCHTPPKFPFWKCLEESAIPGHIGHGDFAGEPGTICGGVDFCEIGNCPTATPPPILVISHIYLPFIANVLPDECYTPRCVPYGPGVYP